MNVLILGMDGYIGWSLGLHLAEKGNKVVGVDNFSRRKTVEEIGSWSATPIQSMEKRMHNAKAVYQDRLRFHEGDLNDYKFIADVLKTTKPDVIVHLGEQPSAPYSMIDVEHAAYTQQNNVIGTLNLLFAMRDYSADAHLLKLGTMGEYGTPPVDIPEGFFEVEHNGRKAKLMFPRYPGSFYHACYDDQTEVLTDNGWKYFSEVEAIDLLATLNLSTKEMQFQKPTAIHRYYYEGLMLHQKHRKIDLCVTPNHRVLFFWSRRYPKLQFGEAAKVKGKQISEVTGAPWEEGIEQEYFTLPSCEYAQNYKGGMVKLERRMPMKNWLPFLGWYLSEGSVDRDPIGKDKHLSYRVALASDYRLEEAKQIFANIGYDASISGKQAIVCDKQLAMYLRRFGRSKEKFIPKEVKSLPRKDLLLLLENLFNGDGHCDSRGFRTYYTSSRRLADDVQEIALKCGYSANLSTTRGHEYRVNVTKSRSGQINLVQARDEWINYRGYVYCATVPNETLLVRRNGKVVFSGNSKVHDTFNIMLACRIWGLRSTDVMQGVVYGTRTHEINPAENPKMCTRFDFDEVFGTAINRYCAEAVIGYPLTVYGKGGQTRGFLALVDSIQCLTLISENPPEKGEYRVFNQIDETYDVTGLANTVKKVGERKGLKISVEHVPNPRKEAEEHHYKVEAKHLRNLGFKQTRALEQEVDLMLDDLMMCKDRIKEKEQVIAPKTSWESGRYLMPSVETHSLLKEKSQESSA